VEALFSRSGTRAPESSAEAGLFRFKEGLRPHKKREEKRIGRVKFL
jgi:hypothetical protein